MTIFQNGRVYIIGDHDDGGVENNYLVARGDRAGEKDGDMAAWAGGPV